MKPITQYVQEIWQAKEGLPQNSVQAIVQTRDGYVWLGTQDGLARFDGVRFTVFNKENTPQIKHINIHSLRETSDGSLWIGTETGLCRYKNDEWISCDAAQKLSNEIIQTICEGSDGKLWIGTWGGGLHCLQNGAIKSFSAADGLSNNFVAAICQDSAGNIWVGTSGGGLNCFRAGKFTAYTTAEGLSHDRVVAILEDCRGNLWIGTRGGGLNLFRDGKFTIYTTKDGLSDDSVWSLFEDSAGVLWIGTYSGGLNRFEGGRFTAFTAAQGLSDDFVWSIAGDREGGLWIGTGGGGLNRLQDGKFAAYTTRDGLVHDMAWALFEDAQENLWIGTRGGGLSKYRNGEWTSFTTENGLPNNFIGAICGDAEGGIWIGTDGGGLSRFKDGEWLNYTTEQGLSHNVVSALFCDRAGALWIGTKGGGLDCFKNGIFTRCTSVDGLSNDFVQTICDDAEGNLWVGTYGGGLSRFAGGEWKNYTNEDGLTHNVVFSIYVDAESTLWICTGGGGLHRFKDEKFTSYTTRDGLFHDSPYKALEDENGNLWLSSTKGVFRVSKAELNEFALGLTDKITSKSFGVEDGMKSAECNGGFQSGGVRLRDGRLCFPTIKGVVVVNPNDLKINDLPPPVVIEKIIVDKREVDLNSQKIVVPPGKGELEFQYTGLSFISPDKVLFRYKLEGFDREWTDAGTRRAAFYTNIPPGEYRFSVTACNSDGVWNETGASVSFKLEPHFYQTKSFYSLCTLAAGGVAIAAYQRRVSQMKTREEELVKLVEKRTSELAEANRELQQLSVVDALTGVANRRRFDEVLETEWRRAQRSGTVLSLIMIDVDYFKLFNDFYGHQAGDACLRSVAQAMNTTINRAGDLVTRYGGEEFAVILQGSSAAGAIRVGEMLRERVEALQIPHAKSNVSNVVTVSLGAATIVPAFDSSPATLIKEADKALYRAKEKGRNRVEILRDAAERRAEPKT